MNLRIRMMNGQDLKLLVSPTMHVVELKQLLSQVPEVIDPS